MAKINSGIDAFFYNYNDLELLSTDSIDSCYEVSLKSIIDCTINSSDPKALNDIWLEPHDFKYIKKQTVGFDIENPDIILPRKINYEPFDPSKKCLSFLSSSRTLDCVKNLKVRRKKWLCETTNLFIFLTFLVGLTTLIVTILK